MATISMIGLRVSLIQKAAIRLSRGPELHRSLVAKRPSIFSKSNGPIQSRINPSQRSITLPVTSILHRASSQLLLNNEKTAHPPLPRGVHRGELAVRNPPGETAGPFGAPRKCTHS